MRTTGKTSAPRPTAQRRAAKRTFPGGHGTARDERYDLVRLRKAHPALARWIRRNPLGLETIDFGNPDAVRDLNQALLMDAYGITSWDLPRDALCPGVPGRRDYLAGVAELLAADAAGVPRGAGVTVFDVGVGANCIYPIIGCGEYGWRFIGTDIDAVAINSAQRIVHDNALLRGLVEIRRQSGAAHIFRDVLSERDQVTVVICNPPFHASPAQAQAAARRKWINLGLQRRGSKAVPPANFGGRAAELWCPGGEVGFLGRMIAESAARPRDSAWYTALVAQAAHLPAIERLMVRARPVERRLLDIARGAKHCRIVAWTFLSAATRRSRLPGGTAR